jgi:hypothetical protein
LELLPGRIRERTLIIEPLHLPLALSGLENDPISRNPAIFVKTPPGRRKMLVYHMDRTV